ncbi:hypothetical protein RHMOL_Rhmol04G0149200 [Rhododendron molle]|uniref:Uncharacterized protein n=1 Tax=Rhododendron molle TaxID=49168 RepID=A0ACC0P0W5_RHOML|nr:hypothetical protein RHMOL_Rhmol04G0149200 [Rhododendron molle]
MARQGVRYGRYAVVEDVYERSKTAREARMEAWFQQHEQCVMDVIGVLTDQVVAMAVGGNPPRCRPIQPRFPKEEEVSDDISITKPLTGNHQSRERTKVDEATIEWPFTSNIISDPIVD